MEFMKKLCSSFVIFLLCSAVNVNATVCGTYVSHKLESASTTTYVCSAAACPSSAPSTFLGTGCTGTLISSNLACVCEYTICCPDTATHYEDTQTREWITTNVPFGSEDQAARSNLDSLVSSLNPPLPGFVLTGELKGVVYDSTGNPDGTSTVRSDAFLKRGYDSPGSGSVTPTPIGGLTGSGGAGNGTGTGGLSLTDTATAVQQGVTNAITPLGQGLSVPSTTYNNPVLPTAQSLIDAKDSSINGIKGDFTSTMNTIKASPLFSLPLNLTNNLPVSGSPVISFNAGVFGSHSYDFSDSNWSWVLLVLRSVIMIAFSYVGIKIVVLKGGGG